MAREGDDKVQEFVVGPGFVDVGQDAALADLTIDIFLSGGWLSDIQERAFVLDPSWRAKFAKRSRRQGCIGNICNNLRCRDPECDDGCSRRDERDNNGCDYLRHLTHAPSIISIGMYSTVSSPRNTALIPIAIPKA